MSRRKVSDSRRRFGLSVTRSLASVGVLALLLGLGACSESDEAFEPADPTFTYGMDLERGVTDFTMAQLYINRPGEAIEILEVKALTSPNVASIGAFTVWPRDFSKNKLAIGPMFPPPELKVRHDISELVPGNETSFLPKRATKPPGLTVAAGFRLLSGDIGAVNGIQVVYKVDGKTVREVFKQALFVCAKPRECVPPDGVDTGEWEDDILRQFGLYYGED